MQFTQNNGIYFNLSGETLKKILYDYPEEDGVPHDIKLCPVTGVC